VKRYVYLLDLKPDSVLQAQYLEHHRHVWACVPRRLKEMGIHESAIYRCGDRLVNVLTVGDDFIPEKDLAKYAEDGECAKWDALMRTYQQRVPGAGDDEWWALCERVY
jgi:L-rhamnose mutarotase